MGLAWANDNGSFGLGICFRALNTMEQEADDAYARAECEQRIVAQPNGHPPRNVEADSDGWPAGPCEAIAGDAERLKFVMGSARRTGFTLVEMSIVLVIIGLVIGGLLVGQSLFGAAGVRATVTQIEKYSQAVNTFYGKYGYLPGDIPAGPAAQFGFVARGQYAGEGDGNGVIEGIWADAAANNCGTHIAGGETGLFWSDLSAVNLIEGTFTAATATANPVVTGSSIGNYLPAAKLGNGNYVYVWSGGWGGQSSAGKGQSAQCGTSGDGLNYFGIEAMTAIGTGGVLTGNSPGLTVQQAYAMDAKVDDGLPQYGRVRAIFINYGVGWDSPLWAAGGGGVGASAYLNSTYAPTTAATPGSSTTCYDNSTAANGTPGVAGTVQHYSIEISNGSNVNCGLSFRFQ